MLRVSEVIPDPEKKRIAIDIDLCRNRMSQKRLSGASRKSRIFAKPSHNVRFGTVKLDPLPFNRSKVESNVLEQTWRERDLRVLMDIHGWRRASLTRAVNTKPPAEPIATEAGAFAFREKLGFFGHNAPKWKSLPNSTNTNGTAYGDGWDKGDDFGTTPPGSTRPTLPASRTIWTDSQGSPFDPSGPHAYLERPIPGLTKAGWLLFTSPESDPAVYGLYDAREVSRADYGLSGRATALMLADESGNKLDSTPTANDFKFRTTTAHAASRRLELAELPIDSAGSRHERD